MILDRLPVPVVLAPLAGGPSTPELAAAVSRAGGLGFLAAGYLSVEELERRLEAARALGARSLGVNLFVPGEGPARPEAYAAYLERLRAWAAERGEELGQPRWEDDGFAEKLELISDRHAVEVVSFTFGCPDLATVQRVHRSGAEVWVTVTSAVEAGRASTAGADVLVVQGVEAGGHRGSFAADGEEQLGLLPLLALVRAAEPALLVAAGGLGNGASVAAVLAAGAAAAQLGSAFLLCPEAGTAPAHREALRRPTGTVLTRAFTGRTARGIPNSFIAAHEPAAVEAYPEIHHLTAPLRRRAREAGRAELINLWAGEAHALARELPAEELVRDLAREAAQALEQASARIA